MLFTDREAAIEKIESLGFNDSFGLGFTDKIGMQSMYRCGDIDLKFIPIELK